MMRFVSDKIVSFSLLVRGKDVRFVFRPLSVGGSVYIPRDADEEDALFRSGMCGRVYVSEGERSRKAEPVSEPVSEPDVKPEDSGVVSEAADSVADSSASALHEVEVKDWQAALEWLSGEGVDVKRLKTPDSIAESGRKAGVLFVFK